MTPTLTLKENHFIETVCRHIDRCLEIKKSPLYHVFDKETAQQRAASEKAKDVAPFKPLPLFQNFATFLKRKKKQSNEDLGRSYRHMLDNLDSQCSVSAIANVTYVQELFLEKVFDAMIESTLNSKLPIFEIIALKKEAKQEEKTLLARVHAFAVDCFRAIGEKMSSPIAREFCRFLLLSSVATLIAAISYVAGAALSAITVPIAVLYLPGAVLQIAALLGEGKFALPIIFGVAAGLSKDALFSKALGVVSMLVSPLHPHAPALAYINSSILVPAFRIADNSLLLQYKRGLERSEAAKIARHIEQVRRRWIDLASKKAYHPNRCVTILASGQLAPFQRPMLHRLNPFSSAVN
ncbi:MAG: hypothetical protein K0S07_605 [Chlamydiales bacterium]|jgi:hypothetical protein|nr:hypothetical protein [Chlamydiales bacterium]